MGCHPSHWLIFFKMVIAPPTRRVIEWVHQGNEWIKTLFIGWSSSSVGSTSMIDTQGAHQPQFEGIAGDTWTMKHFGRWNMAYFGIFHTFVNGWFTPNWQAFGFFRCTEAADNWSFPNWTRISIGLSQVLWRGCSPMWKINHSYWRGFWYCQYCGIEYHIPPVGCFPHRKC